MSGAGALVARGRDAELYEYGRDRLLRRYLRHGGVPREGALMTLPRAAGYPVPWAVLHLDLHPQNVMLGRAARWSSPGRTRGADPAKRTSP